MIYLQRGELSFNVQLYSAVMGFVANQWAGLHCDNIRSLCDLWWMWALYKNTFTCQVIKSLVLTKSRHSHFYLLTVSPVIFSSHFIGNPNYWGYLLILCRITWTPNHTKYSTQARLVWTVLPALEPLVQAFILVKSVSGELKKKQRVRSFRFKFLR